MDNHSKMHVWRPTKQIGNILDLVEVNIGSGSLYLTLVDGQDREITFLYDKFIEGSYVLAFRFASEATRSDLAGFASQARKDFFGNATRGWSLYKMTNSDFIDWFLKHNGFVSDKIEHHIFTTEDEIFEILCNYEPKITTF